jgi:hypothetical protein
MPLAGMVTVFLTALLVVIVADTFDGAPTWLSRIGIQVVAVA